MTEPERRRHAVRWRTAFDVGTTLVMIALAVILTWQNRARFSNSTVEERMPIPTEPIQIRGSNMRGLASARVAMVEYADFECPSCAAFAAAILPLLRREYIDNGRVVYVFKHFPLPSHKQAHTAAQAAWCAGRQGRFWEMHDRLFGVPGRLQDSELQAAAGQIGLDSSLYNTCRARDEAWRDVETDKAEAERLTIPGTPAFLVGRVMPDGRVKVSNVLLGAKPIERFRAILDRLLNKE